MKTQETETRGLNLSKLYQSAYDESKQLWPENGHEGHQWYAEQVVAERMDGYASIAG